MRLLLVDDDGVNRYTVSKALQRVGYRVSEVDSAEAALQSFTNDGFDLVLAEIELPDMSGVDLLREIKTLAPDAVVILQTEYASIERAVQALRYGAKDFLVKPVSSGDLRESVERGMEEARKLRRRRRLLDSIERTVTELAREVADTPPSATESAESSDIGIAWARPNPRGSAINLGPLSVLPGKYQVAVADASVSLTPTEFDLLLYLAAHRGRVVACQELVREVRGYQSEEAEAREVIRPHVSNLRRKLKGLGEIDVILNVRGVGYRLGEFPEAD